MIRQPAEPDECPFEYQPFEGLFNRALRDVADHRLQDTERKAAARALAFLLRERLVTEAVATDTLAALRKSLDVSNVVRTLLLGLVGVSAPEKIAERTSRTAERALAEGHVPSFVSALRVLVDLRDYDGAMRTSWQVAVLRAVELPDPWLRRRVFVLRDEYARRFGATSRWVRTIAVHRLVEGLPARLDHDADPSADVERT